MVEVLLKLGWCRECLVRNQGKNRATELVCQQKNQVHASRGWSGLGTGRNLGSGDPTRSDFEKGFTGGCPTLLKRLAAVERGVVRSGVGEPDGKPFGILPIILSAFK